MSSAIPDFKQKSLADQMNAGREGAYRLLDAGRRWSLAPTLRNGGAVVFPHATYGVCGHQIAAAVHACLDSGAERVVALGVLHARTPELVQARERIAGGASPDTEPLAGVRGPGLAGPTDWEDEFSLLHFCCLWEAEAARRRTTAPELLLRFPCLAGSRPDLLPGIDRLAEECEGAVVAATMDPFHHGIGYGDLPGEALYPEAGGLERVRDEISRAFTCCVPANMPTTSATARAQRATGGMWARCCDTYGARRSRRFSTCLPTTWPPSIGSQRRPG